MKYAVARMQGTQPRLFSGRYDDRSAIWPATPITTGKPEQAKLYDDLIVAEALASIFNMLDHIYAGGRPVAWVAMPIPEAQP